MINKVLAYIVGNLRYKLFYNKQLSTLMRNHIKEQIMSRIISMDSECYDKGQCKMCGCSTTALQMANKPCDQPCYPRMMSRREWRKLKESKDSRTDKWGVHCGNYIWTLSPNEKFERHDIKEEHLGKNTYRLRREVRKNKN